MVPSHATKQGVRYRYYVSQPYLRGHIKAPAGTIIRVPATEIEATIAKALEEHRRHGGGLENSKQQAQTNPSANIIRIEVRKGVLAVWLNSEGMESHDADEAATADRAPSLLIPWTKPPSKRFKEILIPADVDRRRIRPIKFERRAALIKSIARGRAWLDKIVSGERTVESIATRHKCSIRHVNMTISMAFVAPRLVKAAIEGRLPRGIGVANLRDAPVEWSLQYQRLGLASY